MYRYTETDQSLVDARVEQFRDQTRRYLAGELAEEEFRHLRLRNGLYVQRFAPMLRVSIPYGLLAARQLRMLAHIARRHDKGYAHFTTRQNIQFNWPALAAVPDILADLATVQMHAIQTSGNCIRNFTSDPLAGVAADELADPRPYCELARQWATAHPEFNWLPRKFKIAISGSAADRAATRVHDIGVQLARADDGARGYRIFVGGGLGRTPILGVPIREFLPEADLLSYLEAILRVYNLLGRRDNPYKARLKILVKETGIARFTERVEAEWATLRDSPLRLSAGQLAAMKAQFAPPAYRPEAEAAAPDTPGGRALPPAFVAWRRQNTSRHRQPGYAIVQLSLKARGVAPGDITAEQMDAVADLAERYSFGEIRVTHAQNLVLADVAERDLLPLWQALSGIGLATPNIGLVTDVICCPGLDFCSLSNARSIAVADAIFERFERLDDQHDIGELRLNLSGCMNGCGHHSVGHIGVLGVDKSGEEWYQLTLGGRSSGEARLGERVGPAVPIARIADAIENLIETYLDVRANEDERFVDTVHRLGIGPFRERLYGPNGVAA